MYKDFNEKINKCKYEIYDNKYYFIIDIIFEGKIIKTFIESKVIIWMRKKGSFKKECSNFDKFYEFFESVTVSLNYQNNFNIKEIRFELDEETNLIKYKTTLRQ